MGTFKLLVMLNGVAKVDHEFLFQNVAAIFQIVEIFLVWTEKVNKRKVY